MTFDDISKIINTYVAARDSNEHPQHRFLAHLSRRLIGELIVYPWSAVRRPSASVHNAQTSSSQKPLGRSKPNFMWSLLG